MQRADGKAVLKLVLAEDLTARSIERVRDQVVEALMVSDAIELELADVSGVDMTFVDLICGTHRVAHALGKSLDFGSDETYRAVLDLACRYGHVDSTCRLRRTGCLYRCGREGMEGMEES